MTCTGGEGTWYSLKQENRWMDESPFNRTANAREKGKRKWRKRRARRSRRTNRLIVCKFVEEEKWISIYFFWKSYGRGGGRILIRVNLNPWKIILKKKKIIQKLIQMEIIWMELNYRHKYLKKKILELRKRISQIFLSIRKSLLRTSSPTSLTSKVEFSQFFILRVSRTAP